MFPVVTRGGLSCADGPYSKGRLQVLTREGSSFTGIWRALICPWDSVTTGQASLPGTWRFSCSQHALFYFLCWLSFIAPSSRLTWCGQHTMSECELVVFLKLFASWIQNLNLFPVLTVRSRLSFFSSTFFVLKFRYKLLGEMLCKFKLSWGKVNFEAQTSDYEFKVIDIFWFVLWQANMQEKL